jgi:hypothetical protein
MLYKHLFKLYMHPRYVLITSWSIYIDDFSFFENVCIECYTEEDVHEYLKCLK